MTTRRLLVVVLALSTLARGSTASQEPGAAIRIVSPENGAYIGGVTVLKAAVAPPTLPITRLTFFADGKLACAVDAAPYECAWDAGARVEEHAIRAVADLDGGRRLVHNVRTKGAGVAEIVDVDVVQVTTTVTDDGGRFVQGLPRGQFRVFEDDVPQDITSFVSENIPLEIIVAVDVSDSMTDAMPQVKIAVKKFLSALRSNDKVTLVGFNDNIFTLARPGVDRAARLKAVDRLAPWGGTALYDVIVKSIDSLGRQTGRRAMVIFSDGEDQSSHVPLAAVERRVEASDITLYIIGQGRGAKVPSLKEIIGRLTHTSGGRAFFAETADKLDEPFGAIIDELSHQYLLGYPPRNDHRDGRWRRIRVELADNRYHVRARQGYRAVAR